MDCAPETTLPHPQLLVVSNNVSCMLDLATNCPIHFVQGALSVKPRIDSSVLKKNTLVVISKEAT